MRVTFGRLVIAAGISGILSFAFLATSLGTEYWYLIATIPINGSEDIHSHHGLWTVNDADSSNFNQTEMRMLNMHNAIVVVLPFSLVLLLFGGICGLVSSLARSPVLLTGTASYFFVCSLLTLCGVTLYIIYTYQAEQQVDPRIMASIRTYFGWSFGLAWLSYGQELLTGVLLLVAARLVKRRQRSPTMA